MNALRFQPHPINLAIFFAAIKVLLQPVEFQLLQSKKKGSAVYSYGVGMVRV